MRQKAKWTRRKNWVKRQEEVKRLREDLLPEITRRVKIGLILEAIAEKEGIRVEEADVAAEFRTIGATPEIVGRGYSTDG